MSENEQSSRPEAKAPELDAYGEKIMSNIEAFDKRVEGLRQAIKSGQRLSMGKSKLLARILEHQSVASNW